MNRKQPILRRSHGSLASSHSGRTQIESIRKRGGQARNGNAKKCLEWQSGYDLKSPGGIDSFLQEVIKATWEGRLGTRAAGSLNGSLRILLEHLTLPALEKRIEALENKDVKET